MGAVGTHTVHTIGAWCEVSLVFCTFTAIADLYQLDARAGGGVTQNKHGYTQQVNNDWCHLRLFLLFLEQLSVKQETKL